MGVSFLGCHRNRHLIRPLVLVAVGALLTSVALPARGAGADAAPPTTQSAGHSAHGESFDAGPRSAAYLMAGTGEVHFPVTCKSAEAQKFFDQGVGQLHGFWYFEAERSFRQVAAIDPDCVMAYWGMAMANANNNKRAKDFIKEAEQRKKTVKLKPIEAAWIEALAALHRDMPKEKGERDKNLVAALKEMRKTSPDDIELKAFLAYFIWELGVKKENATADKLLDEIFAVAPRHPANHYRIHILDNRDPKSALASAAQCGPAAPGIAHMWHMPGHIYSDLKRYTDAAWQQEAGARVDHAYMVRDRVMPFQIFNYMHNSEWLCRDLMFVGRAHDVMDLAKNMIALPRHPTRGSGLFYGTARLIDTLSQHQMWEEYLAACADGTLADDLDVDQLIRKIRYEGVANAALKHDAAADRCIARLQEQRKALPAAATQPTNDPRNRKRNRSNAPTTRPVGVVGARFPATQPAKAFNAGTPVLTAAGASTRPAAPWWSPTSAMSATRPASAQATVVRPTPPKPAPVDRVSADRRVVIDQAIDHINAEKAMTAGNFSKAAALLISAKARKEHIALAYLAAKDFAKAEDLAKQAVSEGPEQTFPLAAQVLVLHGAGKKAEAAKVFETLRSLGQAVDVKVEPYKSLCAIAPDFGYKTDYRVARKLPGDLGERPPLDALGPFRWHPSPAPDWLAVSSGEGSLSLSQYRGKPVIVLFYLGHGCPHCVRQIHEFATLSKQFTAAGISLVAIGTDTPDTLGKAWKSAETGEEPPAFPLGSDGTLEIFKRYHCYDAFEKMPLHGTFLIDAKGLVRWQDISYEPFLDAAFLLKESKRLLNSVKSE